MAVTRSPDRSLIREPTEQEQQPACPHRPVAVRNKISRHPDTLPIKIDKRKTTAQLILK
ncbi:hypothetical protein ACJ6WF_40225 [Streptomyces sp. MMS24-I2-30]|uniref:hypothetical protein n=1 Tax=Streptomyces sp. MMS24-I2-30 TaxID=3351564 RepID=UPI0038969BB3